MALWSFCIKILTEVYWECAALKKFCEVKWSLLVLMTVKYFIYSVKNYVTLFAKLLLK